MRVTRVGVGGVAGVALLALALLQLHRMRPGQESRVSVQEALLTRQTEELLKLTAAAEKGTLLDFPGVLVVVDQALVQDLLRAITPVEADVGGGFRVRIETADAAFGDGVALVRLTGHASLAGGPDSSRVTVFGAIDVVELDRASGTLQCRVGILGVEADNPMGLGHNDPIGRLTEALGHGGLSLLVGSLEIPVSVENRLSIPAVESKRLRIAAETLPLTVAVQQARAFGGRLWVFVDATLAPRPPVAEPQQ